MELSKREKRKLKLEKLRHDSHEAQKEHDKRLEQQKEFHEQRQKSKKTKYYVAGAILGFLILAGVSYSAYSINRSGPYDNFAKCLAEKGAVMYGAMDWCEFTQAQKGMFGKSFKFINYHEYTELPGIKKTPSWVINGEWHENVQSFDKLAAATGCQL